MATDEFPDSDPRLVRQIAKAERLFLGYEDHGILTCYVMFDGGGWGQASPGYGFDEYDEETKKRVVISSFGLAFIARLLQAFGVDEWNKIKGRTIFVLRHATDPFGPIVGLHPLPTEKGERFVFNELREQFYPQKETAHV